MTENAGAAAALDGLADVSEGAPNSFRLPIMRGLAWKLASRGTFEVSRLAVAIVLARLLTPHEYGLAGMVLVLVAFQPVFAGTALASALVQRKQISEEDRSTVFWTNVATGLLCTIAGVGLSGVAAQLYGDPEIQPLFAAMSLCYVISALGITQSQLLIREMNFRALEIRSMAGVIVGAVLAIVAAASGWGAWAFVVQQLGFFTTAALLLWIFSDWHPRMLWSWSSLRELREFGGNVTATMLLAQLNQNTDRILIGRFLGASALGAYALGYNVILTPFSRLTAPLFDVLYTVYTKLQDDRERLIAAWLRVVRIMVAIALPSMLGLVALAPDVVPVAFGAKWHAAVPVIQILAWVGVLIALQGVNSLILQSIDRTKLLFHFSLLLFAAGLASFVIGLRWGIVGVAGCFAAVSTLLQPLYTQLTARALGTTLRTYVSAVWGVVQASLLCFGAMWFARALLISSSLPRVCRLLACLLVGIVTYVAGTWWRAPELVAELRALVGRRRPHGARAVAGGP